MASMPKRVKIGAARYTVERARGALAQELEDHGAAGLCSANARRIVVDDKLPEDYKAEVFLHECNHAIFADAGIFRGDADLAKHEEVIVDNFSRRLAAFITDNPAAIRYLLEALTGRA